MRIEDVIQRYLPDGGRVSDRRAEPRARLSFASSCGIAVDVGEAAELVLTDRPDDERSPRRPFTVVTLPQGGSLPDVLAWVGDHEAQVVEISRILAPPVTAVVVRHGGPPEVPAVPGSAEPIPATEQTWKRLAGELVLERHNAALRAGELDRLRAEVTKLRRSLKRTRGELPPRPRRRLRLPGARRRPGGDGG